MTTTGASVRLAPVEGRAPQTVFKVVAVDQGWLRLAYPNGLGVIHRRLEQVIDLSDKEQIEMPEIEPISNENTPNPAVITHVRLFQENGSKWIWGQTEDGELTTIYWSDRDKLAKAGGWDYADTDKWGYGEKSAGGNVYELPKALTVHWESKVSRNGREYKLPTSVVTGLELNGTDPEPPAIDDLPTTANEVQDQLEALAPKLKAAKVEAEAASQERKTAKNEAMQKFEASSFMLLDAENKANERKALLEMEAKDLIMKIAAAGAHGHILGGKYQINQKTYMVADDETLLLKHLIDHRLLQYLKVDMDALAADLDGKRSPLLPNMPVSWETDRSPQINWSKLPDPAPDSLLALKELNTESASLGESAE